MELDFRTPGSLPPNPRVKFLLTHRADLWHATLIPLYAGFVTAPLYDHLSDMQQGEIIFALIAANLLWGRYFSRWIESRVGIFRPRSVHPVPRPMRPFLPELKIWGVILVVLASILFLHRNTPQYYHPDGWMEHAAGVWIVMAIAVCLRRTFDKTDLPRRRVWNLVAAGILLSAWSFEGTFPQSYAVLLVVLGVVNLMLALLDVGLLMHLAATPHKGDTEEAHA